MVPIVSNTHVIRAWLRGNAATNKGGTLHTDGATLWSYDLPIGYHREGRPEVINYRGKSSVSQTTSSHVGLALSAGARSVEPSLSEVDELRSQRGDSARGEESPERRGNAIAAILKRCQPSLF